MSNGFDSIARALGHRQRRNLLTRLREENPLHVSDPDVAGGTSDSSIGGSVSLEQVQITMYHTHLPMLDERGFVDWNRDAGTVVKGSNWTEIAPVLELLDEHQERLPVAWP